MGQGLLGWRQGDPRPVIVESRGLRTYLFIAMKLFASLLIAASLALPAIHAQANAPQAAAKPDLAKGEASFAPVCASCHGADGNSPAPANPKLAGQVPEYIAHQLADFKANKERKNPVMFGMASTLSPQDMQNVAAYFGAQKAKDGAARKKETVDLGRKIYRGGDNAKGVVITKVAANSPAAEKQLQAGDVILEVDQKAVTTPQEVSEIVAKLQAQKKRSVLLFVERQGDPRFAALRLTAAK